MGMRMAMFEDDDDDFFGGRGFGGGMGGGFGGGFGGSSMLQQMQMGGGSSGFQAF